MAKPPPELFYLLCLPSYTCVFLISLCCLMIGFCHETLSYNKKQPYILPFVYLLRTTLCPFRAFEHYCRLRRTPSVYIYIYDLSVFSLTCQFEHSGKVRSGLIGNFYFHCYQVRPHFLCAALMSSKRTKQHAVRRLSISLLLL